MMEKKAAKSGVVVSKVSENGQVSLPLRFRKELKITDYVTVCLEQGKIVLEKLTVKEKG